jgi:transposase
VYAGFRYEFGILSGYPSNKGEQVVRLQSDELMCTDNVETKLELTKEQIACLKDVCRDNHLSATVRMRAKILLLLHRREMKYATYRQISEELHIAVATVRNTARRFQELGFEQCMKYQRNVNSNASHKLNPEQERTLRLLARSQPPEGYRRWTLRMLQAKVMEENNIDHVSVETVRQILRRVEP